MLFLGIEESCRRQRKARKRKSYTLYTHSAPLVFRTHSPGISVSAFATSSYANVAPRYLSLSGVVWIVGGEFAFLAVTLALRRFFAGIDRPPALAEINVVSRDDGGTG